jgi:hypothetical protein
VNSRSYGRVSIEKTIFQTEEMSNVEQRISNAEVQQLHFLRRSTFVIRPARYAFRQIEDQ